MRPLASRPAARVIAALSTLSLCLPLLVLAGAGAAAATPRGDHHGPASVVRPTLVARATLDADHVEDGPPSGAQATPANGRTGPFPGQVIPGFSAMVANINGTFWAQPDNGFGAKGNSADFLLRLYLVRPRWETARGGSGAIEVLRHVSLNDKNKLLDFPIVNDGTPDRLLTGADFDIESLVRGRDGTWWIGEEFGPFLLHVDKSGTLLEKPIPYPDGKSPANPYLAAGEQPNVGSSRGFEAMAGSRDGSYLYPIAEGALADDADKRRRWIRQFDTRRGVYTDRRWAYQTDTDANLTGDAFMLSRTRMLVLERDDFDGPSSVTKRVYEIDLSKVDAEGYVHKTLVLDALDIDNPRRIGSDTGYGTGEEWSLPVQSFETIVGLGDGRLLIGNDNNYPGNAARYPGTPDDTELAIVDLRRTEVASNEATVIAHRGASGYRPEHTLAAYSLAIRQCADFIEPDLVPTKDGVLVARHENEIGGTTNVADHPEFAGRRATKTIDGRRVTGWFTEDFTLAELRTLRAKERLPQVRSGNTAFDGKYLVPTFDEVLDLARHSRTCDGKPVGVYPETKHPTYFDDAGLSLEEPLLRDLRRNGLDRKGSRVFLQSFETSNLRELNRRTRLPLVQLIDCAGAPYDLVKAGDGRTYADLVTRKGVAEIAKYADGIGPCKDRMIPRNADGTLGRPTSLIRFAHREGLVVHGFTFRRENQFLPADFRSSANPRDPGDLDGEIQAFLDAGMDGFFTDNPDIGVAAAD